MLCEQSKIITVIIEFKKWFWRQRLRSLSNIVDVLFIAWNYQIWCSCMSGDVWIDWNAFWMSWRMLKFDDFQWNQNCAIESWFHCQVIETALKQFVDHIQAMAMLVIACNSCLKLQISIGNMMLNWCIYNDFVAQSEHLQCVCNSASVLWMVASREWWLNLNEDCRNHKVNDLFQIGANDISNASQWCSEHDWWVWSICYALIFIKIDWL